MLATLILIAHIDGFPGYQRRVRYAGLSVMACTMFSQSAAADWAGENVGWVVERVECK